MPDALPICPHCETTRGALGDTCPEAACARRGYRFIPHGWYATARDAAARRNKPLDPLIGRSLDRYLLAGKLGEGGMGAVYVALQRPLMREVAIKVVSGLDLTEATIARFEREARAVATLDHPNIVKLHDYGVGELEAQEGQGADAPVRVRMPYMALEYLRNAHSIRRVLAQAREEAGGSHSAAVVLSVFEQVLNALTAAHSAGIVHRDVKPDNVMVVSVPGNRFHVKVLDFGLAKLVSEVSGGGEDAEITRTGQLLGTPFYMAPEQAPGPNRGEVDARTDLYAVAVMLYEVFTGVRPFQGDSALEVISLKIDPDYRPLDRAEARGLPRGLRSFLARGLACRPGDRFASADEMAAALRHAVSGRVTTAIGLAAGGGGSSEDPSIAYPSLGGTPSPASPGSPPASPATLREDEPRASQG
ncbi:MAG: serine/threonine protein kinase, partial [Deltaproteobacteria bacterium]|nr:serine/threonine protein kinase [Deltaproteobacteria bacterium]